MSVNNYDDSGAELASKYQEIEYLRAQLAEANNKVRRYEYRLSKIIPLFQEARDALPAISLASAKLRNIDLSLAERMDEIGVMSNDQIDAALSSKGEENDNSPS